MDSYTWDGSDGAVYSGTPAAVSLTVNAVNDPPVLGSIGNRSVNEQATLTIPVSATDQDDPVQTLTYSLDAAAIAWGMNINSATGVFTWTPTESQGGQSY